jgi:hypothetical protein
VGIIAGDRGGYQNSNTWERCSFFPAVARVGAKFWDKSGTFLSFDTSTEFNKNSLKNRRFLDWLKRIPKYPFRLLSLIMSRIQEC